LNRGLELRVDAVVGDPDNPWQFLVLVHSPARPDMRSVLVLDMAGARERAQRLLEEWHDTGAAVLSMRNGDGRVVLRRRRCPEQLRAHLVREIS
jgi:hypothetical protein